MGGAGEGGEAIARYVVGDAECVAAGVVDEASLERLTGRKRYGMDDRVQLSPLPLKEVERRVDLAVHGDVERHRQLRAERIRERLDALLHAVVRVREREFSALPVHSLRDTPGNRAFGGHAYD